MQTHPFIGSVINRVMGITLSVVAWMMYSWLLFCYGGEEIWIACLDGLVSVGLLAAAGFLYGYVDGTIHALQIQVALAVLAQAISLAGAFSYRCFWNREMPVILWIVFPSVWSLAYYAGSSCCNGIG